MRSRLQLLLGTSLVLVYSPMLHAQQPSEIPALEQKVAAGSASRDTQLSLGRAYIAVGRYYEAMQIADRLLSTSPSDSEATELREKAKGGLRDLQQARVHDAESKANASDATDADRLDLANAYFESGNYLSAADLYRKAPASLMTREARLRYARALAWGGQTRDSEAVYLALLEEQYDPAIDLEYGRVLSWMGASKAATDRLGQLYVRNQTEDVAVALANAMAWSGDREGAVKLLSDYTNEHAGSNAAADLLTQISASPELRLERVDRMIELEPYNLALRLDRARLLVDAGKYGEALKTISFVREHSDREIPGVSELQAKAEDLRRQELAKLDAQRATLDLRSPQTPKEVIELAHSYTGMDAYDRAIRLYEAYLRSHPDDVQVRAEYARVLSWNRRYAASAREYERLLQQDPSRADLRLEYAQVLTYQDDFVPAIRTYRTLTDVSSNPGAHLYQDVPARAHFNLGQIYRWFGWNEHAAAEQNSAISYDTSYSPARRELDLVRHVRPASMFDATYSHQEDSSDFQLNRVDLQAEKWTSQRTGWSVLLGRHQFEYRDTDVDANVFGLGGRYRFSDRLEGRARVGATDYQRDLGTRPLWNVGVKLLPSIQSLADFEYAHYDLVYDVFTLQSLANRPINIDDFRAHYDYKTGGHLAYLADASYGLVSDDNNRFAAHGLLTYRLFKEPYVAVKADYRYLSYDFRTNRYWSPTDYNSLAGVLQVGQDIRNRFFWQAELKYGKSWEEGTGSDIRAIEGSVVVPINDALDLVGNAGYGKSGRIDSIFGGGEAVNYWQRHFYVGLRVKRLFRGDERRSKGTPYYFEDRPTDRSPVIPPLGEVH